MKEMFLAIDNELEICILDEIIAGNKDERCIPMLKFVCDTILGSGSQKERSVLHTFIRHQCKHGSEPISRLVLRNQELNKLMHSYA